MATNESWSSFTAFLHRRLYMTPPGHTTKLAFKHAS